MMTRWLHRIWRSAAGAALACAASTSIAAQSAAPFEISGIHPHLAFFNSQGECGIGAVVPWAERLWVVTYSARWNDRIVLGCDDTARSEFLNKRKAKGKHAPPGQSQSNLWFLDPGQLDRIGPTIGRGASWLDDDGYQAYWMRVVSDRSTTATAWLVYD
jgi:hypothetical protein